MVYTVCGRVLHVPPVNAVIGGAVITTARNGKAQFLNLLFVVFHFELRFVDERPLYHDFTYPVNSGRGFIAGVRGRGRGKKRPRGESGPNAQVGALRQDVCAEGLRRCAEEEEVIYASSAAWSSQRLELEALAMLLTIPYPCHRLHGDGQWHALAVRREPIVLTSASPFRFVWFLTVDPNATARYRRYRSNRRLHLRFRLTALMHRAP